MKLKLGNLININNTLKQIIDDDKTKIEPLLKFKLLGILKSIEPHVSNFEIIRNEKIKEFGKETKDGSISIAADDIDSIAKFNESITKLIENEVTIQVDKLKVGDIFDKGVCAEYLIKLYPFIEN